jgi:hypothetical protein
MNPNDIKEALIQACRLTCIGRSITVHLENIEYELPLALPRIEIGFAGVNRSNPLLKGGSVQTETGRFVPVIADERGALTQTADDHAAAIAALFNKGQVFAITGGRVTITQVPTIRPGFPDKTSWRVPLVIPYRADAS